MRGQVVRVVMVEYIEMKFATDAVVMVILVLFTLIMSAGNVGVSHASS